MKYAFVTSSTGSVEDSTLMGRPLVDLGLGNDDAQVVAQALRLGIRHLVVSRLVGGFVEAEPTLQRPAGGVPRVLCQVKGAASPRSRSASRVATGCNGRPTFPRSASAMALSTVAWIAAYRQSAVPSWPACGMSWA